MIIKKINILSLAKIMGLIYAALGLAAGLVMAVFSLIGAGFFGTDDFSFTFILTSVIILPIAYAAAGFIGGVMTAFLFNLVTERIGGLEIETDAG